MLELETARSGRFSCPACGGRMVFGPAAQQLRCPYCGAPKAFQVNRETRNEYDIRFSPLEEDAAWGDETRLVRCGGCKAELVLTGETVLERCPFCGKARLHPGMDGAGVAPDSLIPFQIMLEEAQERCRREVRFRLFAPRVAKNYDLLDRMAGVYLPQWMYHDEAASVYQGRAGARSDVEVPVTVTDPDGKERTEKRRAKRTRWKPASGTVSAGFDDIMTAGSDSLPDALLEPALPYQMSRLVPYAPEYVAGFACEKPTIDVQNGWLEAQQAVDRRMTALAERDILGGADEAEVQELRTTHKNVRYRLVLLPMYLSTYTFRKKTRRVLVNGQNGKVAEETPVSPLRVAAAVLFVLCMIAGGIWWFMAHGGAEYMLYDLGGRLRSLL